MIRAVIFDLGHTIWDIRAGDGKLLARAYAEFRARLCERIGDDGVPSPAELQEAVRLVLKASAEMYFEVSEHLDQPPAYTFVDRGCRSLGLTLDEALLRELTPPLFQTEIDALSCTDGTIETLRELSARGSSGAATHPVLVVADQYVQLDRAVTRAIRVIGDVDRRGANWPPVAIDELEPQRVARAMVAGQLRFVS